MRSIFVSHGFDIVECIKCDFRSAEAATNENHVAATYDDSYFNDGGAGYSSYLAENKLLRAHGQRYAKLIADYAKPGKILDVGAAAGFILQGFVDAGWTGLGIEPNVKMADVARRNMGLNVVAGTLEETELCKEYDLVSFIQVVSHFVDVRNAFSKAAKATKDKGFWLIETWNRASLTARVFGRRWHEYSPPSVLHWFTPDDIKRLAAQFGFRAIAQGRPQKWLDGAHAASLLRHKIGDTTISKFVLPLTNLIPKRMVIPYPAEDLFWIILQKNE